MNSFWRGGAGRLVLLVAIAVGAFLGGCALAAKMGGNERLEALRPKDPGSSLLLIYRRPWTAAICSTALTMDGKPLGRLGAGDLLVVEVAPGPRGIVASPDSSGCGMTALEHMRGPRGASATVKAKSGERVHLELIVVIPPTNQNKTALDRLLASEPPRPAEFLFNEREFARSDLGGYSFLGMIDTVSAQPDNQPAQGNRPQ